MRSKELADLAGVTVRTLRHYHQMGLLPEPPRAANGYREYRATDVAQVLRIKHLTSLGMPLRQVKEALDSEVNDSASLEELLDALDAEYAEEIALLHKKRQTIARLRHEKADPDVPATFGSHIARMREAGTSEDLIDVERTGLLLVDRLLEADSAELHGVESFFELLNDVDAIEDYVSLNEEMLQLPAKATEAQRQDIADRFSAFLAPLLVEGRKRYGWKLTLTEIEAFSSSPVDQTTLLRKHAGLRDDSAMLLDTLLDMYDYETLNEAQLDANERIVDNLRAEFGYKKETKH